MTVPRNGTWPTTCFNLSIPTLNTHTCWLLKSSFNYFKNWSKNKWFSWFVRLSWWLDHSEPITKDLHVFFSFRRARAPKRSLAITIMKSMAEWIRVYSEWNFHKLWELLIFTSFYSCYGVIIYNITGVVLHVPIIVFLYN